LRSWWHRHTSFFLRLPDSSQFQAPVVAAIRLLIEQGEGGGAYVLFPYDTEKEFATKGRVPVKATFEGMLPFFEKLSYSHRKEYCRWITEAKKEETRLNRLEKAIEMLKKGVRTPG
jgi:hypothetical protein